MISFCNSNFTSVRKGRYFGLLKPYFSCLLGISTSNILTYDLQYIDFYIHTHAYKYIHINIYTHTCTQIYAYLYVTKRHKVLKK